MFKIVNSDVKTRIKGEIARRKLEEGLEKRSVRTWRFFAISAAILLLSVAVYCICFLFKTPFVQNMTPNQLASYQVISTFEFTYTSEILTNSKRKQAAERVAPSYMISKKPIERLKADILHLENILNLNQSEYDEIRHGEVEADMSAFLERISQNLRDSTSLKISPDDLRLIYRDSDAKNRRHYFNLGTFNAEEIISRGIYADDDQIFSNKSEGGTLEPEIQGEVGISKIRNESRARKELLRRMRSLGLSEDIMYAMYRILNQEIIPNIEFDQEATEERKAEARAKIQPVKVTVREGEALTGANAEITPLLFEKLKAYRHQQAQRTEKTIRFGIEEFTQTFLLVAITALFIIVSKTQRNKRPKTVLIFSVILLLNLSLERFIIELTNIEFGMGRNWIEIFAFGSAIALGPIIQVLLFGSYTGFIMALLISSLTTLMMGQTLPFFIVLMFSSLIAIYFCDGATTRSRVLLGGAIYGAVLAFLSQIMGSIAGVPFGIMWRQALMAILSGVLTGLLATALLPLIGRIFNAYSNIALLEFTDLNNPLLKKLQLEAPGTYHHSVMVSHIAEEAAASVNANPLVCRVGALYHDIGKLIKPEYFAENQRSGRNPHDEQTASMSALIIKSHVTEGLEMAKHRKMPAQVVNAIAQHHGTSTISYFYNKAKNEAENDPMHLTREVEESTYRHEGTKPQTVENAIIMLADSCEAASRSLKKVTQHGVEELVDAIFKSKMTDGQLDECLITMKQISKIKSSFARTMLSMAHARVEYNNDKKK